MPEESSRRERGLRKGPAAPREGDGHRDPLSPPRQTSPAVATRQPLPRSVAGLPALEPHFWTLLHNGLERLGVRLSAGAYAALDAQTRLLLAWNPFINLTALRTLEQIARGHLLDSLSALPLLRRLGGTSLLDLGSGAGYPGLPLAVGLPASRCALVDSVAKKQTFLATAGQAAAEAMQRAGEQPPQFLALDQRAEDLADEPGQRESWDIVVARALGSLAEVFELGLPLARIGGHVVAWKRRSADGSPASEVRTARRLVETVGGGPLRFETPSGLVEAGLAGHVLIVVRKRRSTPERYPRPAAERRRAAALG